MIKKRLSLYTLEPDEIALAYYLERHKSNALYYLYRFTLSGFVLLQGGVERFLTSVPAELKTHPLPPFEPVPNGFTCSNKKTFWRFLLVVDRNTEISTEFYDFVNRLPDRRCSEYIRRCAITGFRHCLIAPLFDLATVLQPGTTSSTSTSLTTKTQELNDTNPNIGLKQPSTTAQHTDVTPPTQESVKTDEMDDEIDLDDPMKFMQNIMNEVG